MPTQVHSVCSLDCPDSCGVLVTVNESGRATKIQGDPSHPVTRGFLCGKVAKYLDRVYSPDRLLYPMRRKLGVPKGPLAQHSEQNAFERITWDEALNEIASRLKSIAAEHGAESILPYSYAGTIGQLGYGSMDRRFFHRLGASQLDRTICSTAGGAALLSVYGIKLGTEPQDFAHSKLIIAWGANIHGNNIHLWPFIEEARRNGAKLVVIDPYRTRTAALADVHLAIRPGTDTALALSMMQVILKENLQDDAYIAANTHGFADLKTRALEPKYSPEAVAELTGLTSIQISTLARQYATTTPSVIRLNYGIQRSDNGGTAARAVAMLPLLTGSWKHKGGGLQLSTSGAFPFNTNNLQRPDLMPTPRPRTINMIQLGEALTQTNDPPVKALFVYNSNPAAVAPNSNAVLKGMQAKDLFTVVHDQFHTDTADYADILLPCPSFIEQKDVQGAYGHLYAQLSTPAIAPLGEARSNVSIFSSLGQRLFPDEPAFRDSEDDLIAQALDTEHPWFKGITPATLSKQNHIRLNLPASLPFSTPEWFKTPTNRGQFSDPILGVPEFIPSPESRNSAAAKDFPLELLARKADNYMNSTFANIPVHQNMEIHHNGTLEIHPDDANSRQITTGDTVEVFNPRGTVSLQARLMSSLPLGVVAARLNWNKLAPNNTGINVLTSERTTDIGAGATFYSVLVEVRKSIAEPAPLP